MAFLVKGPWSIVSAISQFFRTNQVVFKQVFDDLTFKHIDALRKQIQSLVDYVFGRMQC